MTTEILARVPVDEITAQAREVKPGRTVLTVVAAVLFGLGWVTAKVFATVWLGLMWAGVAVRVGWKSAHGPSRKDQIAALTAQVTELQVQAGRFRDV